MAFFNLNTVSIWEEVTDADACGVDSYNNPLKCLVLVDTVDGDLQPANSTQSDQEQGAIPQGTHVLFLDLSIEIKPNYKIQSEDYDNYFQVVGEPQRRRMLNYQKVVLNYEGF